MLGTSSNLPISSNRLLHYRGGPKTRKYIQLHAPCKGDDTHIYPLSRGDTHIVYIYIFYIVFATIYTPCQGATHILYIYFTSCLRCPPRTNLKRNGECNISGFKQTQIRNVECNTQIYPLTRGRHTYVPLPKGRHTYCKHFCIVCSASFRHHMFWFERVRCPPSKKPKTQW